MITGVNWEQLLNLSPTMRIRRHLSYQAPGLNKRKINTFFSEHLIKPWHQLPMEVAEAKLINELKRDQTMHVVVNVHQWWGNVTVWMQPLVQEAPRKSVPGKVPICVYPNSEALSVRTFAGHSWRQDAGWACGLTQYSSFFILIMLFTMLPWDDILHQ